jgi:SET domain-containing protein 6
MVTTRSIRQGEQIVSLFHTARRLNLSTAFWLTMRQWNTYGDPPNSDLLRRYGHVDQVPLADGGLGNPADIVEIRADLVMEVVGQYDGPGPRSAERLEWWLEEGGDECANSPPSYASVLQHPDLPSV